ncbi:DUF5908 family protein [Chitinophaga ginsengisoli]|uniref:Uncharacterized protein n=1 Tax=Chitinophaga ginsengisoli TaxID=363837 RepID=A0A2P8GMA0_9BACT|nr:DUF5908 family protein [Chitinophaga ginsengisoli]PSL35065.1 hypothetical protein CLV42_102639 [Chitinophaga ginsengisoli]
MPVEIREMVIKVAVDEAAGNKGNTGGSQEHQEGSPDAIVRACVEKVLEILKDQRER